MNISRNFVVIGSVYLIVGLTIGLYMGASGDHSLAISHAHINLLGFTLMLIFGMVYKLFPDMAGNAMAKAHFWLHQIGAFVVNLLVFLLFNGNLTEEAMMPVAPIAEVLVLLGAVIFAINAYRNAR